MISRVRVLARLEAHRHRPELKDGVEDVELSMGRARTSGEEVEVGEASNFCC